jgi:predicted nucleotidyltransferase component of viral defense system
MSELESANIRFHEDAALFREALNFTAAQTTFLARLIEKDYFCTVILKYLADALGDACIFKGGTCLAKVHVGFYRLSEDLDFTIPVPLNAGRRERSQKAAGVKRAFAAIPDRLPGLKILEPLRGANDSAQYLGTIGYVSALTNQDETIQLEVALREPLLMPAANLPTRTMLLDPLDDQPLVADVLIPCISKNEAFAEKFRAAATRRDVAIRDFYDLDHATLNNVIDLADHDVVALIREKLAVPGNERVNLSDARLAELRAQLEPRLRPVLRERDYKGFDLDRAFSLLLNVAKLLD